MSFSFVLPKRMDLASTQIDISQELVIQILLILLGCSYAKNLTLGNASKIQRPLNNQYFAWICYRKSSHLRMFVKNYIIVKISMIQPDYFQFWITRVLMDPTKPRNAHQEFQQFFFLFAENLNAVILTSTSHSRLEMS